MNNLKSVATVNGGAEASLRLTVTEPTAIEAVTTDSHRHHTRKVLEDNRVIIEAKDGKYDVDGKRN